MSFYAKANKEHWLRDRQDEGRIVILEDESVWEIHPSDRAMTARWLRISTIEVKRTEQEPYPYLLTNSTEKETVRANHFDDAEPGIAVPPQVA